MNLVEKIIIAILGIVIISKFLTPLLIGLFPPFGLIAVVALYLILLWFILGQPKF